MAADTDYTQMECERAEALKEITVLRRGYQTPNDAVEFSLDTTEKIREAALKFR